MKPISGADRMPQLDGLRAVAFAAVAISHWAPKSLVDDIILPWGTGVHLFFVLSGFLITGILLSSRPVESGISLRSVLKIFYARRILRIFPLYYAVIGLSLLFAIGPIYSTWPWHVSFLSNLHYAWHSHSDVVTDPFLHLWSLSVEEQFYLVWPFVVLVSGRRALPVILVSSIVGSMAFRISVAHLAPEIVSLRYLTPSCLDALAAGGLIAYVQCHSGAPGMRHLSRVFAWVGIVGLLVSNVPLVWMVGRAEAYRVGHTFLVIFYAAVVAKAALGFGGLAGRLLSLKPVVYLGRISYGLYVYHYFAPAVLQRYAKYWGGDTALQRPAIAILAYAIFTLVVAVLSWHLYELPINRLKRYFPFPARTPIEGLPAPALSPQSETPG